MFCLNNRPMIKPEMSKYLRDLTNKSVDNHFKTPYFTRILLNKNKPPNNIVPYFLLLPFVSLLSFLAGYNYCKLKTIT